MACLTVDTTKLSVICYSSIKLSSDPTMNLINSYMFEKKMFWLVEKPELNGQG